MNCQNEELSYLKYWDVNNLHGWAMSQTLPITDYKWIEDISDFDEIFMKSLWRTIFS